MPLTAGARLGRYEVVSVVGAGRVETCAEMRAER